MAEKTTDINQFIRVMRLCGRHYLYNGGPTSRLEDKVYLAGKHLDLKVEAWCTPTGLFLSVENEDETITALERIRETGNVFSDFLFYGRILDKLGDGRLSLNRAEPLLERYKTRRYSSFFVAVAAFIVGALASFIKFGYPLSALVSGFIAFMVFMLQRPVARRLRYSGVFSDFVSSLLAFFLSTCFMYITGMPMLPFVIGSLIIIVPGLTLTVAISEIAEHNFVSGTVKLVKSVLVIIAMGVSYLLIQNTLAKMNLDQSALFDPVMPTMIVQNPFVQIIGRSFLIGAFCIFFHIPFRAIPGAVACSLAGSLMLDIFVSEETFVLASYLAAFSVGLTSLFLARLYKWPSQIFSTPGVLALVPGLLALSAFYNIENSTEGSIAYRVCLTAGAVVFGLFTARMPFRYYYTEEE